MTPEEIATLRLMAATSGLVSLTGKELSTLLLERDHHAAEAKALREAAEALVDTLTSNGGGAHPCGACYALATVGEPLPRGGSIFRCDKHASPPDPGDDAPPPYATKVAAPLRALRALLGRTP